MWSGDQHQQVNRYYEDSLLVPYVLFQQTSNPNIPMTTNYLTHKCYVLVFIQGNGQETAHQQMG